MAAEIDFELIEKVKEILQKEMADRDISDEDIALLEEDNPAYFDQLVESIISDFYDLISDAINDSIAPDIEIIKDEKGEVPDEEEIEEEVKKEPSSVAWEVPVEWRKKK